MTDIPINLAVEDDLSEAILKEILKQSQRPFAVGMCLKHQGYGYLKRILPGINHAAKGSPYLVLTDLDRYECPLAILTEWLSAAKHPNLIFRVAVTEVEAWLLAHREAFARFVGISINLIPDDLDSVPDPKRLLIDLTRKSKKRNLRDAIVPRRDSLFYQIFQQCPALLADLLPDPPANAAAYHFASVAVKEPKFEIDGVFLPPKGEQPGIICFCEAQFQKDDRLYERLFSESCLFFYQNRDQFSDWYALA
ncbi:DUF2887 domain-containing protein [Trichothermofontia sp.]